MASSGNFATLLNGLLYQVGTNTTYSIGNTKYQSSTSGAYSQQASTIAPSSGKWYAEMYVNTVGNLNFLCLVGDIGVSDTTNRSAYPNRSTNGGMGYAHSGLVRFNNSDTSSGYSTYTDGDIIQIAFDIDNTKVWFGKNNTWQNSGDPANGTNASYTTWTTTYGTVPKHWHVAGNIGNTGANTFNFGQDDTFGGVITAAGNADGNGKGVFKYAPPTGFLALCSGNLSISEDIDPAEEKGPNTHFDVVTYTGNGSTQSITSLGFQPDWTLIKNRSTGDWCNQNSSLGVGKVQLWNDSGGVSDDDDCVTAFNSNGFSLGDDSKVNTSSANYVAYCWKKSAAAGLDIVTYSGGGGSQAVSHSLGAIPDCIFIMLNTGSALDSIMYLNSSHMGTSYGIFPTLTNARQNSTYVSATTSSNFTVTTSADTSGRTYFAYVLKSIEGFSKFGEYIANADANGPFTYLGFRPHLIIIKALESGQTWFFFDTARSTFNPVNRYLYGQRDLAEDTAGSIDIDFLASGFKIRNSRSDTNSSSGQAYAYLSWADVPYKYNNTF